MTRKVLTLYVLTSFVVLGSLAVVYERLSRSKSDRK